MKLEEILGEPNGAMFECAFCEKDIDEDMRDIGNSSDVVRIQSNINDNRTKIWWFCCPECALHYIYHNISTEPLVVKGKILEKVRKNCQKNATNVEK